MEKYLKYYEELNPEDTDSFKFTNTDDQKITVNLGKIVDNGVTKWVRTIVTEKGKHLVKVDKTPAEQKEAK